MAKPVRRAFVAGEQTVYEWEQTLEEVMIFIYPPDGLRGKDLDIKIEAQHIRLGIKGNPPFIDAPLEAAVSVENSLWTLGACDSDAREAAMSMSADCCSV